MAQDSVLHWPSDIVQKSFQMSKTLWPCKTNGHERQMAQNTFQLTAFINLQSGKQCGFTSAGFSLDLHCFQNRIYPDSAW